MKKIKFYLTSLISFTAFVLPNTNYCQTFTKLTTGNATSFDGLSFCSDNNGYVSGGTTILKTVDGGANWTLATSPCVDTWDVFAVRENSIDYIYAVGDNGKVSKSSDGGNTWIAQSSKFTNSAYSFIFGVWCKDKDNCYLNGGDENSAGIVKTTDGGTTWSKKITSGVFFEECYFADANTGYAVGANDFGGDGVIAKSTDGGNSWNVVKIITGEWGNSLYCTDANTCYVAATGGAILKTSDGGSSWQIQNSGTTNSLFDVRFINSTTGYIVGTAGTLLKTTNGGTNWMDIYTGTENLASISVPPSGNSIYVAGSGGTILKAVLVTGIDETSFENRMNIYPNPTSGNITIELNENTSNVATISIANILGEVLCTKKEILSHSEEINLKSIGLSSGIYFIKAETKDSQLTQKVILTD